MKILLTGGAGYIGTSLTKALNSLTSVKEIVIYDNLSRPNFNLFIGNVKLSSKVRFVHEELLDSRNLRKEMKGSDVVIHAAARVTTPFDDSISHSYEQVNHWGTAELVYAVEELGISHLIHLSSATVYGSSDQVMSVGDTTDPKTFYGISKLKGEQQVQRLLGSSCKTHILRCGNVFGYNKSLRLDSVINRLLFDAHFNKCISVHGSGDQQRPFVHIDSVAQVICSLLSADVESGTYDLVERNHSINDVARTLKELYPDLEMLFIDQNLKMRELQIRPDEHIIGLSSRKPLELEAELSEFAQSFTF